MRRREYLAGTVSTLAAIAGCTTSGARTSKDSKMKQVTDATVSGLESTNIEVEPSVDPASITPEQTAEIAFTIIWNGSERQQLVFGSSIPYTTPKKSTDPPGLLLVADEQTYERVDDQTWVPKVDDPENLSTGSLQLKSAFLEPGESVSHTWTVWADPGETSQIEPGTYRFDDSIALGESSNVEWSLSVEIDG